MTYKKFKVDGSLIFMDPSAKQQVKSAFGNKFVELDMSGVNEIDSSGVDLLTHLIHSVKKKNGTIRIIGANAQVREVFEICGLDKLVELL